MKEQQPQPQPVFMPFFEQEEKIDFKKYFFLFLSNWYWFVLAVFLTLGAAWVYHRFTNPRYAVSASLLINEDKGSNPLEGSGGSGSLNASDVFQGFGLFQGKQNLENQIQILQSWTLVSKAVNEMNAEVSYYEVDMGLEKELYNNAPFRIEWLSPHQQLIGATFEFDAQAHSGRFILNVTGEKPRTWDFRHRQAIHQYSDYSVTVPVRLNEVIERPEFAFRIIPVNGATLPEGTYRFRFNTHSALVDYFRHGLTVATVNKDATLLNLKMESATPAKSISFLNKLMEVYQQQNLDKKNEMATRTIQFISSQLGSVSDSLTASERHREQFQSRNNLLDLSYQSQQLLDQMVSLQEQKEQLSTQKSYYTYLLNYLKSNNDLKQIAAPSTVGINNPMLVSLLQQLAGQTLDLTTLETTVIDKNHPTLQQLRSQIEVTKKALIENSRTMLHQSNMAIGDIDKRLGKLHGVTEKLPEVERNFVNIERKYRLDSDTYTFLLQKLSEAKIAKASNTPDNDIIDPAMLVSSNPISPNKRMDYLLALFLGLALPGAILLIRDWMDDKIRNEEEVKKMSDIPVLGNIPHAPDGDTKRTSLLDTPNSPLGEAYRALRQTLKYFIKGKDKTVLAITSAGAGEGKTFSALSTAASFALMGHSTVVLDLDLRRSTLAKELHLPCHTGVSSYLAGTDAIDDIIFSSRHRNLKIIPAGEFPPNPGELLADEKMGELIAGLKERFDRIVIDSSPLLVADLFQYASCVDGFIFVIRQGLSRKPALEKAMTDLKRHQLKNLGILYNDVMQSRTKNGYGYGYGYGYEYVYGFDPSAKQRKDGKIKINKWVKEKLNNETKQKH